MKKDIETYKKISLVARVAFVSIFCTGLFVVALLLWWSSGLISNPAPTFSSVENTLTEKLVNSSPETISVIEEEDIESDESILLPNTFYGSNIEISYPEGWRIFANESGGLMKIVEPKGVHSVLDVTYVDARFGDIGACEAPGLAHGRPTTLGMHLTDGGYETSLLRYQGINKLGLTEIKIVLLEGAKGGAINRCTIFNFENPWTPDNLVVTRIADSMALNFVGSGRGE